MSDCTVSLEMSLPGCVGSPKRVSSLLVIRLPTSEGGALLNPPGLEAQCKVSEKLCGICLEVLQASYLQRLKAIQRADLHLTIVQSSPLDLRRFSDCSKQIHCSAAYPFLDNFLACRPLHHSHTY